MAAGTHQQCGHSAGLVVFDPSDRLLSEWMFSAAIFEGTQTASQLPNANHTTARCCLRRSDTGERYRADDYLPSVHVA